MTDRELLEDAAKAAGIDWADGHESTGLRDQNGKVWNPLTDDGDALRLAVKLRRFPVIEFWSDGGFWVFLPGYEQNAELLGTDPYAATRRAVVRAAAAISKEMK